MMDWDFINDFGSSQSLLDTRGRLDMDEIKTDLKDMQSMESVDLIYFNYLDSEKKIPDVIKRL